MRDLRDSRQPGATTARSPHPRRRGMAMRHTRIRPVPARRRRHRLRRPPHRDVDRDRNPERSTRSRTTHTHTPNPDRRRRARPARLILMACPQKRSKATVRGRTRPPPGDPRATRPPRRLPRPGALRPHDPPLVHPSAVAHPPTTHPPPATPSQTTTHPRRVHAHPIRDDPTPAMGLRQPPMARHVRACVMTPSPFGGCKPSHYGTGEIAVTTSSGEARHHRITRFCFGNSRPAVRISSRRGRAPLRAVSLAVRQGSFHDTGPKHH